MANEIYISGALFMSRNLSDMRALYEFAADVCDECGHVPYVPHKHTDPELRADADPVDVYEIDSKKVIAAKAVVAFANEPSFGAGMELMLAVQHKVPVIVFRRSDIQVSRYLRGFMISHGYGDVVPYSDEKDLKAKLLSWLSTTFAEAA